MMGRLSCGLIPTWACGFVSNRRIVARARTRRLMQFVDRKHLRLVLLTSRIRSIRWRYKIVWDQCWRTSHSRYCHWNDRIFSLNRSGKRIRRFRSSIIQENMTTFRLPLHESSQNYKMNIIYNRTVVITVAYLYGGMTLRSRPRRSRFSNEFNGLKTKKKTEQNIKKATDNDAAHLLKLEVEPDNFMGRVRFDDFRQT